MRISDSQLSASVRHSSQQILSEEELSATNHVETRLGEQQRVALRRESIDLVESEFYESEKSSRLYSKSNILNADASEQVTITQEEMTNALVSGVLEREAHIGNFIYDRNRSESLSFGANMGVDSLDFPTSTSPSDAPAADRASTTELIVSKQKTLERNDKLTLVSEGEISTDDGREISFRLELDLDQRYFERTEQTLSVRSEDLVDPLVISLDGRAPTLSNATFTFDIDNDGVEDNLSRLSSGAGFLALDLNNDGIINNGGELFGPQSGNGYADLAAYDENGDGWIDESDAVFSQLQVWQPGESEEDNGSLISLKEAGVGAISLQSTESPFSIRDENNNTLGVVQRSGVYLKENGQAGLIQQIDLVVQKELLEESASEDNFLSATKELELKLQQHFAANPDAIDLSQSIDLNMDIEEIEIDGVSIEMGRLVQPIMIVSQEVQFVERIEERVVSQQSSFQEVVVEPVKDKQKEVEDQLTEVLLTSTNPDFEFSGKRRSDSESLGIDVNEDKHAVLNSIIEDVLRPLHEQLQLKRQRANEAYSES